MKMPVLTILFVFLLLTTLRLTAQDTLWVRPTGNSAAFAWNANSGETVFMLAKRYSVPPALLADVNQLSYSESLRPGRKVWIPLGAFNLLSSPQEDKSKPLYYRTAAGDDLPAISRMAGVSQSTVQRRNGMDNQHLPPGRVLLLGWVAFDREQVPFPGIEKQPTAAPNTTTADIPPALPVAVNTRTEDHTKNDTLTAFGILYGEQTEGVSLSEENGAAVFYPLKAKAAAGVYYAFHNTALRGTILKVSNPANGKTVYAKVIGPVPALKEYHNCILGLSDNAAAVLEAREKRMFCNISYR